LHGVDWDVADVSSADSVEVPEVPAPTSQNGLRELNEVIDPLKESDCHGIDIYIETLEYIWNRI
jgi:hypothetical protein